MKITDHGKAPLKGELSVSINPLEQKVSRLPLMRELSPQATEGEKMLGFYWNFSRNENILGFLSPSQLRCQPPRQRGPS